jgi:predicted nucleotidyltransferase component of viral defense system
MDRDFYHKQLYPFQDRVLRVFTETDTGFYLGGGTALSRGYIDHLFSDDLDLFVNDDSRFSLWADRIIQSLTRSPDWRIQINLREERLVRLDLTGSEIDLKID